MSSFVSVFPPRQRRKAIAWLAVVLLACALACSGEEGGGGESAGAEAARGLGSTPEGGELGESEQVALLASTASSELPAEVRIFSIERLGELGPEGVPAIAKALTDPDPKIVLAAVNALPDTKDAAALEGLRSAAQNRDPKVKAAAAARLRQLD